MWFADPDAVYALPPEKAAQTLAVAMARLDWSVAMDSLMPATIRDELYRANPPKSSQPKTLSSLFVED